MSWQVSNLPLEAGQVMPADLLHRGTLSLIALLQLGTVMSSKDGEP